MIVAAVKALAGQAPALRDPDAALLPDVTDVREISVRIAAAVTATMTWRLRTAIQTRSLLIQKLRIVIVQVILLSLIALTRTRTGIS